MTRHVAAWKSRELEQIKKLANEYPVIAVASLHNFPAALFQKLRKKLHGKAVIKVSKTRVIRRAFEQSNIDAGKLNKYVNQSVAVIFTSMNPFELYSFLKRNKGNVAAKHGMFAPEDIIVPACDTGLPPGPALSDLKAVGLRVMVQGPTIHIAQDKVVAKKGETISAAVAGTLSKLDIKPIKVGLNVIACYENKEVFEASVLNIDAGDIFNEFRKAYLDSLALAIATQYFTKESVEIMLRKAAIEAICLDSKLKQPVATAVEEKPAEEKAKAEATAAGAKPAEEKKEAKHEKKAEKKKGK